MIGVGHQLSMWVMKREVRLGRRGVSVQSARHGLLTGLQHATLHVQGKANSSQLHVGGNGKAKQAKKGRGHVGRKERPKASLFHGEMQS